jgi:hypothetical protein
MSRMTVADVVNANAGKNAHRAGLRRMIGKILSTPDWTYNTSTLAELDSAAADIARRRPDIVRIGGGDGTVQQTVTRILRAQEKTPGEPPPLFLIKPMGTMNITATVLGLTMESALSIYKRSQAKIDAGQQPEIVHLAPMRVNDQYGFLYGAGVPVNLLQMYYADEVVRGKMGVLRVLSQVCRNELWSAMTLSPSRRLLTEPVYAKLTLPAGFDPPVGPYMKHTAIMCGAIEEVGLGCRALPGARSKLGHFTLRSSQLSFWGYVANSINAWNGWPLLRTFDAVVPNLTIDYQEPTVTMLDGEMREPTMRDVLSSGPMLSFITG